MGLLIDAFSHNDTGLQTGHTGGDACATVAAYYKSQMAVK
jgi:hypothetical protein